MTDSTLLPVRSKTPDSVIIINTATSSTRSSPIPPAPRSLPSRLIDSTTTTTHDNEPEPYSLTVNIPHRFAGHVVGKDGFNLKTYREDYGVTIYVPPREEVAERPTAYALISGRDESRVKACAKHIEGYIGVLTQNAAPLPTTTTATTTTRTAATGDDAITYKNNNTSPSHSHSPSPSLSPPLPARPTYPQRVLREDTDSKVLPRRKKAVILIDNHEVFHGAQLAEPGIRDTRVRLNVLELTGVMTWPYKMPIRKVVAGNLGGRVYELYAKAGYFPIPDFLFEDGLQLLNNKGNVPAVNVDDLDDHGKPRFAPIIPEECDLVIATTNGSPRGANFPGLIRHALTNNFHVFVYVWRRACPPIFRELEAEYPEQMAVKYLDDHRAYIAYAEGAGKRTMAEAQSEANSNQAGLYTHNTVMPKAMIPLGHYSTPPAAATTTTASASGGGGGGYVMPSQVMASAPPPVPPELCTIATAVVQMNRVDLLPMIFDISQKLNLATQLTRAGRPDLTVLLLQSAAPATFSTPSGPSPPQLPPRPSSAVMTPGTVPGAGQPAYVFIDNSNVFGGAQLMEDGSRDKRIRVNIRNLTRLVERGLFIVRRAVAGSFPPPNSRVWDLYRLDGYVVLQGGRTGNPEEQLVDEALHSHMLDAIADHKRGTTTPGTIVLVTGDGNSNIERGTSFVKQVERAAREGWTIHMWSWKKTTARIYHDLTRDFPERFFVHDLDPHRKDITFSEVTVADDGISSGGGGGGRNGGNARDLHSKL